MGDSVKVTLHVKDLAEEMIKQGWTPPPPPPPPVKPHPIEKYIELGLDIEFSRQIDKHSTDKKWYVGILKELSGNGFLDTAEDGWFDCRLRPNHVHWWGGKSNINPIPEDCEYNYYLKNGQCYGWYPATQAKSHKWSNITAFEIRYK